MPKKASANWGWREWEQQMKIEQSFARGSVTLATLFVAPSAYAGGFMLQEQSPLEIGRAFSGAAASADNPSTIFYNPAGMTELEGVQIATGATLLFVDSAQANIGTSRTGPGAVPASPVSGTNGGNPFAPVVAVPASYAVTKLGDSGLWIGLGLSSPFGLKLDYSSEFFGRYDSIHSKLLTINAQPSLAYRISDAISVGAGLDIQYADVALTNALPPLDPAGADGLARVAGDDVSLGWNAGILVKLDGGARVGLHYRSQMKHQIKGESTVSGLAGPLASANGTRSVRSPLTLPASLTVSLTIPVDKKTKLMLTGRHYNWSVFQRIAFFFPDGSSSSKEFDYKDSWSLSAGVDRVVSKRLTLRAGAMFDRTPTNDQLLSTRVPDGNRRWLTAGLSYRFAPHLTFNASYAHVFIGQQTMVRTEAFYSGAAQVDVTTRTRSKGNVDMLSTSVIAHF